MDHGDTSCNFLAPTVLEASYPVPPQPIKIAVRIRSQASPVYRKVLGFISPDVPADVTEAPPAPEIAPLNLEPGDWVMVRPLAEILETLDGGRKYKGLYFMPEMEKYCEKKFRVFRKVQTIKLESTGEVRRLRSPSVFLEGVYCNGERHQGCDRACFHFWREAWLKRIPDPDSFSSSR